MTLSPEQHAAFQRDGFLVLNDFLSADQVAALRAETHGLHERLAQPVPGVQVTWQAPAADGGPRVIEQALNAELLSPTLAAIIESEPALAVADALLGPDLALYESKLVMKAAGVGGEVPWHQDFAYWTHRQQRPAQLNLLIYIDDADQENGCLEMLAGSHARGVLPHARVSDGSVFEQRLTTEGAGELARVELPGRGGTAIVFGPQVMHRSAPNRSTRQRRSLTISYTLASIAGEQRKLLRKRAAVPDLEAFYALDRVPFFSGPGPHGGQCARAYLRRELWRLAMSRVADPARPWVEIVSSESDGGSFEFFAGRKPAQTQLVRFERLPAARSNRLDARVITGAFEHTLARANLPAELSGPAGLIYVDSDFYRDTNTALQALADQVDDRTVLVLDKLSGFEGWQQQSARALYELLQRKGLGIAPLGRTHTQLALVVFRGSAPTLERSWTPRSHGVSFGMESYFVAPEPPRAFTPDDSQGFADRRKLASFFPINLIPQVHGAGPEGKESATHSRRRELWHYALSLVEQPQQRVFCEFGVGEGESLDFFALHKPAQAPLIGFDSFTGIPEEWAGHPAGHFRATVYQPNRADVSIVTGDFDRSLAADALRARLGTQVGFVHIDCDLYSSTRTVLERLSSFIDHGTVIVFDELYGYTEWEHHEIKAFYEFVHEHKVEFEYLARSDYQVAVRILAKGTRASWSVRPLRWQAVVTGIDVNVPVTSNNKVWRLGRKALLEAGLLDPARTLYGRLRARKGELGRLVKGPPETLTVPEEQACLTRYAANVRGIAVEIGTFKGGSACVISKALPQGAQLLTIDPYVADSMEPTFQGNMLYARANLLRHGDFGKVRFIRDFSENVARDFRERIDLLWIDGDHTYSAAKSDFERWSPHLKRGGYVLFHDSNRADITNDEGYSQGWCGPTLVCREIRAHMAATYELVETAGSITVFRKREDAVATAAPSFAQAT